MPTFYDFSVFDNYDPYDDRDMEYQDWEPEDESELGEDGWPPEMPYPDPDDDWPVEDPDMDMPKELEQFLPSHLIRKWGL